jgi:hypothetical protein
MDNWVAGIAVRFGSTRECAHSHRYRSAQPIHPTRSREVHPVAFRALSRCNHASISSRCSAS